MYSNRSECGQRPPPGDRRPRQRDDHDDRREPHSYGKYGGDGHGRRSGEYSGSPPRQYGKDSSGRRSPARRRASSPGSEKARRRVAEDDGSEYRYRPEPWDKPYKRPAAAAEGTPQKNDFKYRDAHEAGRRYRQEDPRCGDADVAFRRPYRDGGERSWDRSQERSRSRERPAKSYGDCRERAGSPPAAARQEDRHPHAAQLPLNGASEQMRAARQSHEGDVGAQRGAAAPGQKQAKGFQRFLDILNKGVNMDTLSKIVTQTPARGGGPPAFPSDPVAKAADRPWSPEEEEEERGEGRGGPRSPPPRRRSLSPRRERRSRSPSAAKTPPPPPTPEDEHKRRQMQDVLRAIGLDLGLEELGRMSHRIQERLYGRKDGEPGRRGGAEGAPRPATSPKRRSRSSSSSSSSSSSGGSSFTPEERGGSRDSYAAEKDAAGGRGSAEYEDAAKRDADYRVTAAAAAAAAAQLSPPVAMYAPSGPPPAHAMPPYSPVACPPPPYPPPPLPPPPPMFPHVPPTVFVPHRPPPAIHFPHMPPLNAFPPRLPFPPPPPPPVVNPQLQSLNAAQTKAEPRRRCLKVIQTKPG